MLKLFNLSSGFVDLVPSDQTLQQLKNAGGFRLLDKEDADSIMLYDQQVRLYLKAETTGFQQKQYEIRTLQEQLLNYGSGIGAQTATLMFTDDKKLLNRYFNALSGYRDFCYLQSGFLKKLKQEASSLLTYFKDKYHFK